VSYAGYSADELARRTLHRRAVEAVIWGMPAVNMDLLYQSMARAGAAFNQFVYWSGLPDWKNQTLTPNPDTIYLFAFINAKDAGPVVLEVPPADEGSITGTVDDAWQTAIEDVGPAGVDKGKGGKYLLLPPGHAENVPDGYIPMPSQTWTSAAFMRSIIRGGSDADIAKAVAYGKRMKVYPLSQASNPPETAYTDVIDMVFDNVIPYDIRFFEGLDRVVQREPWIERDRAMIDMLKSIGIEKGKPFKPDSKMKQILEDAAKEARAWLEVEYGNVFLPYYDTARWALPVSPEVIEGLSTCFATRDSYPVYGRGLVYSFAYFSARHLGAGQFYLMTIKDKDGKSFDGDGSCRLTVPANAPVKQYWSTTVYDRATHALICDQKWSSRASTTPGLQKNMRSRTPSPRNRPAQAGSRCPQWDQASQTIVREALLTLQSTLPDFKKAFGARKDVDPVRHLIGSAAAWGGNPDKDAIYLNVTPKHNDGKVVHRLTVRDVPVDGFWSISLYNAKGYYEPNPQNAYSLNNITAKKDGDGSVTIQFGGCDSKAANCLPIMPG
jgi:hypothetical protein